MQAESYTQQTIGTTKAFIIKLTGLNEADSVAVMKQLHSDLEKEQAPYVTIYDIGDFYVSRTYKDYSKRVAAFVKEQGLSKGTAIVGVTGLKKIFAKAIKPEAYWASSLEDAFDWAKGK